MKTTEFIEKYRPCRDAVKALEGVDSMSDAWTKCDRPDWLFWICEEHAPLLKDQSVTLACRFARRVLHLVPESEDRPRLAIEAAEKWLEEPTVENADAAARAANVAYADYADDAAARSAYFATYAAAYAHSARSAYAQAAACAADKAAYNAAFFAARAAEGKAQCEIFRAIIPNPFDS